MESHHPPDPEPGPPGPLVEARPGGTVEVAPPTLPAPDALAARVEMVAKRVEEESRSLTETISVQMAASTSTQLDPRPTPPPRRAPSPGARAPRRRPRLRRPTPPPTGPGRAPMAPSPTAPPRSSTPQGVEHLIDEIRRRQRGPRRPRRDGSPRRAAQETWVEDAPLVERAAEGLTEAVGLADRARGLVEEAAAALEAVAAGRAEAAPGPGSRRV